jgi:hypothetical protein
VFKSFENFACFAGRNPGESLKNFGRLSEAEFYVRERCLIEMRSFAFWVCLVV